MSFWQRFNYLRPAFRRREERDMQEELESLEAIAGRRELGNLTRAAEERREVWGWTWLEQWVRDVQYSARSLRKSPAFTFTAIVSLALGIGANTAIFSLIDALLLRWLPVRNPQELVLVTLKSPGPAPAPASYSFSYPLIHALANQREIFSGVAGFSDASFNMGPPGAVYRVHGAWVTGAYYETLGLNPEAGRLLTRDDDEPGAAVVAVLSHDYWDRQFARSPAAIGQTLLLDGFPVRIAGVSPPGFVGANVGSVADITLPLAAMVPMNVMGGILLGPGNAWLRVVARPRSGVSVAQAEAGLAAVWPQVAAVAASPTWPRWLQKSLTESRLQLVAGGTGWTYLRDRFRQPLLVLMGVVGLVLLVACANVANLLLARGTARQHEIGIRLAIGARRGRVIRQLLTESLWLAGIGAACGILLAWLSSRVLVDVLSSGPSKIAFDMAPNWHVLAFTGTISIAASILFGLAPALQTTATGPSPALKEDSRISRRGSRFVSSLVVVQLALSLPLLIGAGLFLRTLQNLRELNTGFRQEGILVAQVSQLRAPHRDDRLTATLREILDRVQHLPGVLSASLSNNTPMSGGTWSEAAVPKGQPIPDRDTAHFVSIGPRFFETMGTPLVSGREFTDADQGTAPAVAIINEAYKRRYFADEDPVGKYISATVSRPPVDLRIVGVVKDTVTDGLRSGAPRTVYVSYFERPQLEPTTLEVLAAGNLSAVSSVIRRELQSRFPDSVIEIRGLSQQVEATLVQERLMATLASGFGMLALALAGVGLYGVLAYVVTRRANEIGIRLALGAQRLQVLGMVVKDAAWLLAFGVGIGLVAAWAASRFVASMLFGVTPADPWTILEAAALLVAAGLLAGFLPGYRASRVSPMEALRHE